MTEEFKFSVINLDSTDGNDNDEKLLHLPGSLTSINDIDYIC